MDTGRRSIELKLKRLCERLDNLKECFRISSLINSSLELDEVLENIMTAARSILRAESCSLMLVDEKSGELVFQVAQGPVANKLDVDISIKKGQGIAGHVFETGTPVLIEDAYADPRFDPVFDAMTGYITRSILCAPLLYKERVIGVSQIINKVDGGRFTLEDVESLSLLSINAALAVENARLHREILQKQLIEKDLAFASNVQLSFLPREMPVFDGFRFSAHYQAAREVGGDFYDFIPLDGDRLGVLIGDVSGKGVASALFMARLTSDFRMLAIRIKNPEKLISRINDEICDQIWCRGMFAALQFIVIDSRQDELTYVNAGHLPPILWNSATGKFEKIGGGGPPAGVVPGYKFKASQIQVNPGDCLLLATDGLVESRDASDKLFGWEMLERAIRAGDSDAESLKERVIRSVEEFAGHRPPADDITMVVIGIEEG